jgi:hypothetical protein
MPDPDPARADKSAALILGSLAGECSALAAWAHMAADLAEPDAEKPT